MNQTDKKQFSAVMVGLAENFGGTVSPEGMRARFKALVEYDISQIVAAGDWLIKFREKTFPAMPMVSEFISTIKNLSTPQISIKSRAEIQVDIVLNKLKNEGHHAKIDFKDPITMRLMTSRWPYGSWAATVYTKELVWWRKEFVEAYQAYGELGAVQAKFLPPGENTPAAELERVTFCLPREASY